MKGKVKFYCAGRGYGFITCEDGREIFFHINDCPNYSELFSDDEVEFEIEETEKGTAAKNVTKI